MTIARLREGGPCRVEKEYKRHNFLSSHKFIHSPGKYVKNKKKIIDKPKFLQEPCDISLFLNPTHFFIFRSAGKKAL
jgi:hypothetical protein